MKYFVSLLSLLCWLGLGARANAQCYTQITSVNGVNTPSATSGAQPSVSIAAGQPAAINFVASCPGHSFQPRVYVGCPDAAGTNCGAQYPPGNPNGFQGGNYGWYDYTGYSGPCTQISGQPAGTYSCSLNLSALAPAAYDLNVELMGAVSSGSPTVDLGGVSSQPGASGCPVNSGGRHDCDVQITWQAGPTPTPAPTPGAATSASPQVTAPGNNAVLSGMATAGANANANGTYDHIRWSFGYAPPGPSGELGFVNIPYGSSTAPFDTTKFANNNYQLAAAVCMDSACNTVINTNGNGGWSPLVFFSINNAVSTPSPTPSPTATPTPTIAPTPTPTVAPTPTPTIAPTSTPTPAACGFTYTGTQIIANCPIVAPKFITASTPTPTPAPTASPVAGVMKNNDFLNTLGVTSHIVQQGYTPAQWEVAWDYLGVRHDRDDFTCDGCDPHNWNVNFFIPEHQKRGVTFIGMPYTDIGNTFSQWDQLGAAGALFALEGPNEPNNQPFTYNGVACNQGSTFQGCANFQKDLLAAARADVNTKNLPMFSITEVGAEPDNVGLQFIAGFADYANLHNYVYDNTHNLRDNQAWNAEAPDAAEAGAYDGMDGEFVRATWYKGYAASALGTGASIPRVTTETGYPSFALSADMKGKVLASVLLDGAARGWAYTFIYQMMDDSHDDFGLFNNANPPTPKLAATYIHNLTTILADTSSSFTPTVVNYSISPLPATVHSLLLQKSNGKHDLVIWDEAFVSQTQTTVTVSGVSGGVVYDITQGTTPVAFTGTLTLSDHPVIVEF